MAIQISSVHEQDLPALLAIQRAAFQVEAEQYGDCAIPPLRQTVDDLRVDLFEKVFLKAIEGEDPENQRSSDGNGTPLGSIRASERDGICSLEKLSVDPAQQRRGIGRALLLAVEERFLSAQRFVLFTGHRSEGNLRLYESLGYRRVREEWISDRLTLVHLEKRRSG